LGACTASEEEKNYIEGYSYPAQYNKTSQGMQSLLHVSRGRTRTHRGRVEIRKDFEHPIGRCSHQSSIGYQAQTSASVAE